MNVELSRHSQILVKIPHGLLGIELLIPYSLFLFFCEELFVYLRLNLPLNKNNLLYKLYMEDGHYLNDIISSIVCLTIFYN